MTSKDIAQELLEAHDGLFCAELTNITEEEILKLQKDLEILDIIKSKSFIDFGLLEVCKIPDEYNDNLVVDKLTVDEFYKLKEWLENDTI